MRLLAGMNLQPSSRLLSVIASFIERAMPTQSRSDGHNQPTTSSTQSINQSSASTPRPNTSVLIGATIGYTLGMAAESRNETDLPSTSGDVMPTRAK
jgi:hypothetical protein